MSLLCYLSFNKDAFIWEDEKLSLQKIGCDPVFIDYHFLVYTVVTA